MRLVSLVLAAFALSSAPAVADVKAPPTAIVATTAPGSTLTAADSAPESGEDQLVVTLRGAEATGGRFDDSAVDRVPLWPNESVLADHTQFSADLETARLVVGGAVEADVAAVEQVYGAGKVLRMTTVAGAGYAGHHAGQVRFFAGEISLTLDEWSASRGLRFYDAAGALLYTSGDDSDARSVSVLRREVARTPLRFGATLTTYDDPLPLAPLHRAEELCLTASSGRGEARAETSDAACQDTPLGSEPLRLGGIRGCGAVPTTLTGFVPAATREVAVVLGSGAKVRYGTRATPFGRAERIVTAVLPRGEAIRTVTARDAAGRALVRGNVGAAPPDRRCTTPAREWGFLADPPAPRLGVPPGAQIAAGGPDGPRLLVREVGDQVCAGVDALALDGSDCADPPLNSRFAVLDTSRTSAGGTVLAGLFAAKVTALSVLLADGSRVALPATESAGYTGRFHSALHFAFAVLAPGATPVGADLLDAAGRPIGHAEPDDCACDTPLRFRTVLSRAGFRISQHGHGEEACIALAAGARRPQHCQEYAAGTAAADAIVTCAPRRTVVFGVTPHHLRRVELELASGGRAPAALRRRAGVSTFLAVLPADAVVERVRLVGVRDAAGQSTVPMALYGAKRQCGYGFRGSL
jgi:hypothetical protein